MVEQAEVEATLPEPPVAFTRPNINKVMPEEWRAAAADQNWSSPAAGRSCRRPGQSRSLDPEEGRASQPAWPLILLPLEALRDVVKKAQAAAFDRFRPVSSLLLVALVARPGPPRRSPCRRRAQAPTAGRRRRQLTRQCTRPTKLARIDGALVPLAPRSLPSASRIAGSFRSSAKAGDWRRMSFLLTDRSEVAMIR